MLHVVSCVAKKATSKSAAHKMRRTKHLLESRPLKPCRHSPIADPATRSRSGLPMAGFFWMNTGNQWIFIPGISSRVAIKNCSSFKQQLTRVQTSWAAKLGASYGEKLPSRELIFWRCSLPCPPLQ